MVTLYHACYASTLHLVKLLSCCTVDPVTLLNTAMYIAMQYVPWFAICGMDVSTTAPACSSEIQPARWHQLLHNLHAVPMLVVSDKYIP